MSLPTWSEVLAAPYRPGNLGCRRDPCVRCLAFVLAKGRLQDRGWWAFMGESIQRLRPEAARMFALLCVLAERDR